MSKVESQPGAGKWIRRCRNTKVTPSQRRKGRREEIALLCALCVSCLRVSYLSGARFNNSWIAKTRRSALIGLDMNRSNHALEISRELTSLVQEVTAIAGIYRADSTARN